MTSRESEETSFSFHTRTTSSYLQFFRSPVPNKRENREPAMYTLDESVEVDEEYGGYVPEQYRISETTSQPRTRFPADSPSVASSAGDESSSPGLSILSSDSHLFGERIMGNRDVGRLSVESAYRHAALSPTSVASRPVWVDWKDNVGTVIRGFAQDVWRPVGNRMAQRLPQSPRSRNLADLNYLIQANQSKLDPYKQQCNFDEENYYDFVLVLQPQETYAYWASLLDFRPEVLDVDDGINPGRTSSESESSSSNGSSSPLSESDDSEARDQLGDIKATPATGIRRRNNRSTTPRSRSMLMTTPLPSEASRTEASRAVSVSRLSMFEKATFGPEATPETINRSRLSGWTSAAENETTPSTVRRRWGNHYNSAGALSPLVHSLTRQTPSTVEGVRPTVESSAKKVSERSSTNNELEIENIPNDPIPRGMIARTQFLSVFLSELRRGIVVRRHRPDKSPVFVKLLSSDGGDTIKQEHVTPEEATMAFREQRIRYNKNNSNIRDPSWSRSTDTKEGTQEESDEDFVPDFVAAQRNKQRPVQTVKKLVTNTVLHRQSSSKIENLLVVHPATHEDPRHRDFRGTTTLRQSNAVYAPDHTFSLVFSNNHILRNNVETEKSEVAWVCGSGADAMFKHLDFEAATIGEYWLLLRGFLLLRRDAAVGRFAEQRKAGIGSHYSRLEHEQRAAVNDIEDQNRLHQDEFHEPVTVGCLEKLFVKWRKLDSTYMEGFTREGAVPPPSDYFLGFKSPGTSIWSRLRLAGLQTQRVYSLDPRRVMIKVRCPSDRLMDVAEVLRLKIPTCDGSFAPFREDAKHIFRSHDDGTELPFIDDPRSFHFRSSIRQTLINFIICSRIIDSGAELGQSTDAGKMIQGRVPLHMPRKVDAIYKVWAFFWKEENWVGRDGCSLSHEFASSHSSKSQNETSHLSDVECGDTSDDGSKVSSPPHILVRFFKGCFHLPLDSIEEYFGEKTAFYFAWLQHTSFHLVWLAAAGLIMFLMQVTRGSMDHPLRPIFSFIVMIWTFLVLLNWKKRANFLAYRWGTLDYKEQETTRPEFRGEYVEDPITKEYVVTYPKWKRWLKYCISFPLTLLFTTGALFLILCVHANRDQALANYLEAKNSQNTTGDSFSFDWSLEAITSDREFANVELSRENFSDPTFWYILIGMPALLGLCQPLLNLVLMKLSVALNHFENYRTVSEYRTHLIIKVIAFRFVCYFAHLYYYAFSSIEDEAAVANGLLRVGTGVAVYTTVAHWWQVFLQIEFPILIRKLRMYYRRKRLCEELREIELKDEELLELPSRGVEKNLEDEKISLINKRLLLEQAQDGIWLEIMLPEHNSFAEYIQAVVLFSYVACFSAVLPITPLIVLFNYLVSMRLDAFKVCKGRRRPLAEKTGGIGVWEHLLHIVAVISVLTNCWLMGFTNATFIKIGKDVGEVALVAIIVGWEHVMLLIKYVLDNSITQLPRSVKDAIKREQHELDMQRNVSMRLFQGRRSQHERESLPAEDRTRGMWRNVPSIRLGRSLNDNQESPSNMPDGNINRNGLRTSIDDSETESMENGSVELRLMETPRVGRSDKDQGIRTLFSA